jgi:hypothetical protein
MADWRTSTRSATNGNCVQVSLPGWRTATRSSQNGNCVEVALHPDGVGVRDSKDRRGPQLWVTADAWRQFIADIRKAGP